MKKIININLSSRLIPIEDTAYEILKAYLDSLKRHFSREEGGEEIVDDIEGRIAEVFQDKLKKGAHCITDEDVNAMIISMGRPEQLEEETATEPQEKKSAPSAEDTSLPFQRKQLQRDQKDKVLGGVCSGLAAYFNIDPVIVRVIAVILGIVWGSGILVYIILWIALPSSNTISNPIRKRLYRNPDHRVVAGVCSGIASYLNLDPVVPRLIFISPLLGTILFSIWRHGAFGILNVFFSFSVGLLPTLILVYIILWIAVPKAITLTEKLEMRGEKVDLMAITNAMKTSSEEKKNDGGSGERPAAEPVSQFPDMKAEEYSPYMAPKQHSGLGEIILFILKIIGIIMLTFILIGLCISLVAIAGGFMGAAAFSSAIFPLKGLLLDTTFQHILAWPAIFLTLGIPVVAIIWLLIKLITGFRPKTRLVGIFLSVLWVIGIICAIWLSISLVRDFRMNFRETEKVAIQEPSQGKMVIRHAEDNISFSGWSMFGNTLKIADDTVIINSVRLQIEKSPLDSFQLELIRTSDGPSVREARRQAEALVYNVSQQDSILLLQSGLALPQGEPYRDQRLIVRLRVPVGKHFIVEDYDDSFRHWRFRWDDWGENWNYNTEYIMTEEGPKSLEKIQEEKEDSKSPDNNGDSAAEKKRYHYQPPSRQPAGNENDNNATDDGIRKTVSLDGLSSVFYAVFDVVLKNNPEL